jgi:hypothetical protein
MTKHIRIENADTAKYRVKVVIQDKVFTENGHEWVTIGEVPIDFPTAMCESTIHTMRRLIVEENGVLE